MREFVRRNTDGATQTIDVDRTPSWIVRPGRRRFAGRRDFLCDRRRRVWGRSTDCARTFPRWTVDGGRARVAWTELTSATWNRSRSRCRSRMPPEKKSGTSKLICASRKIIRITSARTPTAGLITEGLLGNRYVDIDRGYVGRILTNDEEIPGRQEKALKEVVKRSADLMEV